LINLPNISLIMKNIIDKIHPNLAIGKVEKVMLLLPVSAIDNNTVVGANVVVKGKLDSNTFCICMPAKKLDIFFLKINNYFSQS